MGEYLPRSTAVAWNKGLWEQGVGWKGSPRFGLHCSPLEESSVVAPWDPGGVTPGGGGLWTCCSASASIEAAWNGGR